MKKILGEVLIRKLKKAFLKKREVLAVYIFGSRPARFANLQSDLDMAVFVSDRNKTSEREIIRFLRGKVGKIPFNLDLSCVDFASPPLFLYQIIKNGVCIFEKEPFQRAHLEATILKLYYDNQHLRNIYRYYLQQSLEKGTYGY